MIEAAQQQEPRLAGDRLVGRVPVRNIWLLMLYASDLVRTRGDFRAALDRDIDDIPDLVAHLLAETVERRLRRNLTQGYRHREQALTRVRGRIDFLATESRQLMSRGEIFCRYEELTADTPRNRLVRAALELMGRLVRAADLSRRCRTLAAILARSGVNGLRPSRAELATDQIGRNDAADARLVALARLAFDLALPTEDAGFPPLLAAEREEAWVRHLFEKAILGFARVELEPSGWRVSGGTPLRWPTSEPSPNLDGILPHMVTDIVIDSPTPIRRMVIDTKFTSILKLGRFGKEGLKSGYLYQMYAYLRSQEDGETPWRTAMGMLLHPAVGFRLQEHVTIQGHKIFFATINLGDTATKIREELRSVLQVGF